MTVHPPMETHLQDLWRIGDVFLVLAYGEWTAATSSQIVKIGAMRKLMLERGGFVLTWTQHRLDAFVNQKLRAEHQVIPHRTDETDAHALTEAWCSQYDIDRGAVQAYFKEKR